MRRNLKHQLKHGLRLAMVAVPVLWLSLYALFSPSGYLALRRQQKLYQKEAARVQMLAEQNRALNQSVLALRSDPSAIEGIAREQLHLTKPGEIVYTYPMTPARGEEATANARAGMRPAR